MSLLRKLKKEYDSFRHKTPGGARAFSLRELVTLIGMIFFRILPNRRLCTLIQAYDDFDGDYDRIKAKYNIPHTTFFRYLNSYIRKPFLDFCQRRNDSDK